MEKFEYLSCYLPLQWTARPRKHIIRHPTYYVGKFILAIVAYSRFELKRRRPSWIFGIYKIVIWIQN